MPPELDYATMSSDILIKGNLKKAKNWKKRFFVLRDGSPAKLEYYESERKWKSNSSKPKKRICLENPWNISKKKDSKHEFLIVIFTEDDYFSMAADNAETQEQWVIALQQAAKPEPGSLLFEHMWHVILDNKELEGCKNSLLVSLQGPYRVCLTHDQMVFVRASSNGGGDRARREPIEIRITSIRVFGHKEGLFFIVPGRASGIGSGKLWMDLNDPAMADNMHHTILQITHALNQEESNGYRGRSYSSGSNSSRSRRSVVSVRSHHNNPPPSLIGMGKMASGISGTSDRVRCDSLPVPNVGTLNESRLRTGSEGENTMRRPSRINSMRYSNGSTSPGMRNRFWVSHNRRGTSHCSHHPNTISHSHTTSLSSSCNGSSATSSCEHLNTGVNANGDLLSTANGVIAHLPPSASSPAVGERMSADDHPDRYSPTQSYLQITGRKGSIGRNYKSNGNYSSNGRSPTPEFVHQSTIPPLIHENYDTSRHYCTACLAHIPFSQTRNESSSRTLSPYDLAPPPPDMEPPSYPHNHMASSCHDYANVSAHCRTVPLEESGQSSSTAASSLSASPSYHNGLSNNVNQRKSQALIHPPSHGPEQEINSFSPDEYTPMAYDGNNQRYPHQETPQKPFQRLPSCTSSIIDKLVSSADASSCSTSDYTPMSANWPVTTSFVDNKTQPRSQLTTPRGYVAMRSAKSLSQDIGHRRRSMPDATLRHPASSQSRSSAPCSFSADKHPAEVMNSTRSFCQECSSHFAFQKSPESTLKTNPKPAVDGGSESNKDASETGSTSEYLAPTVCEASVSPPSPTAQTDDEYLNMQPLQQEIREIKIKTPGSSTANVSKSNTPCPIESSSVQCKAAETNGYLLMSPVGGLNGHPVRKNLVGSILSVAEHRGPAQSVVSQYPHQRTSVFSTNSLDRPRKSSFRTKKPLSLGFRHSGGRSARRSQSLKQGKKALIDHSPGSKTAPAAPSRSSLSPEDEYVNIDFSKAKEQLQSPYVVNVIRSEETSPKLTARRAVLAETDYTEMNLNSIAKRSVQAST